MAKTLDARLSGLEQEQTHVESLAARDLSTLTDEELAAVIAHCKPNPAALAWVESLPDDELARIAAGELAEEDAARQFREWSKANNGKQP